MTTLARWLADLGLGQYAQVLADNDIDLDVAPELTDADLAVLGLSLGHRRKFLAAAAKLRADPPVSVSPDRAALPQAGATPQAERRQVTVFFCDLVGSTALSGELDPEDMSRMIRLYQDTCAGIIARYDGFVAKFMGDGVLAYFGYPQAHEDAAERAVKAGIEIVAAVGGLVAPKGLPLQTRVGIATGVVVVGELIGAGTAQEQTIVGDTPNLAARLQSLAEPGSVLINATARQLVGELFEYQALGEQTLKGITQPVPVWRVLRERAGLSRFDAVRAASSGTMVGREHELSLLVDRWRKARDGVGQVVMLSGEAGIGKSRLVEALRERIGNEPHIRIRCQCSPYHKTTALYPVTQHLAHAAGFVAGESAECRREKLEKMLARAGTPSTRTRQLFAALLGVPAADGEENLDLTAAQQKAQTLAALVEQILALAERMPVFLHIEDAHWVDPTTTEMIDKLLSRLESAGILVLITYRPEFAAPWVGRPAVTSLSFNRLGREHCAAMARQVAPQTSLPADILDEILQRSDGVPLYVEELTRAVIESGLTRVTSVPSTLQDSLMARLDRLGATKDVAQIAAVIGRDFSYELLATVVSVEQERLQAALEALLVSGLVFPQGRRADGRFSFKHALVQETAYENLLRSRRRELHEKIAKALETRLAQSEPAVVAHHYGRAGLSEQASGYWEKAGDDAAGRSAYAEAEANFRTALEEASLLQQGPARTRRLLGLRLKLGPALSVTKGLQSEEVAATFREAYELGREVGEGPDLFRAIWGLSNNAAVSGRFEEAAVRADELIGLGRRLADEDLLIEAYHCRWSAALFRGEIRLAIDYGQEGAIRYDPARHAKFAAEFGGHDVGVCAHGVRAMTLSQCGGVEETRRSAAAAVAIAETLGHPYSLAHGLNQAAASHQIIGDAPACERFAARLMEIARKFEFTAQIHLGTLLIAWSRGQTDAAAGFALAEPVLGTSAVRGQAAFYNAALIADLQARTGRAADALSLLNGKLADASVSPVGFYVSELWRLKGELLLRQSAGNRGEAERSLRRAIEVAERQQASLLRLRAAAGLARLLGEAGRREEGLGILQPAYADLSNETGVPEVMAAGRLLAELA